MNYTFRILLIHNLIHGWRKDRDRERDRDRVLRRVRDLNRDLNRDRDQVLKRVRDLNLNRDRDRDRVLKRILVRNLNWDLDRILSDAVDVFDTSALTISDVIFRYSEALKQPMHRAAISQTLCTLLNLETKPQWVQLTAERLVPRAGENINLFSGERIRQTLQAFAQGRPTRAQCRRAASLLLIDAWLWLTEVYKTPADSRFKAFAEAPFFDTPELHIAQLLWAASYGDESKADELTAIIKNPASPYRDILTRAYWIDDENERIF